MSLKIGTDWIEESRTEGHPTEPQRSVLQDMCTEERWFNVFARYIQPYHRFNTLAIGLIGWRDPYGLDTMEPWMMKTVADENTLAIWRRRLIELFENRLTGIRHARLYTADDDDLGLSPPAAAHISMRMARRGKSKKQREREMQERDEARQKTTVWALMDAARRRKLEESKSESNEDEDEDEEMLMDGDE